MYKYKLANKIQEGPQLKSFQQERVRGFERVDDLLGQLAPLLAAAKADTVKFYQENPDSLNVLYGTDIAADYILDLIKLFKPE